MGPGELNAGNRNKLRPDEQPGQYEDFTFFTLTSLHLTVGLNEPQSSFRLLKGWA